jgi:pilus assembly protein CpaE
MPDGPGSNACEQEFIGVATLVKSEKRRPKISVHLLGSSDAERAQVRTALDAVNDPKLEITESAISPAAAHKGTKGSGDGQTSQPPARQAPDVVIVMLNETEEAPFTCLQQYAGSSPRPALFAVLPESSPALMRQAVRAGADELLFAPVEAGDAMRALIKVAEARQRTERGRGGMICSVTSLMGGVGVTSLSVNLALALRYALDRRVALIDLDLQTAMASVALNLEPETSLMTVVGPDKSASDSIQVEAALTKHDSGLYLLAAPKRLEESDSVDDRTVQQVLETMRQMFDFVIVDCGNHVNEQTVTVWENTDQLFYLLDQSIGGARCAWRFLNVFQRLKLVNPKLHLVLSRYMLSHPVSAEQLTQTLLRPIYAAIPRDDKTMERAEMSGQDLWHVAPNSALTKSYEELARKLAEIPGEARVERGAGVVSRLVSAIVSRSRGASDEVN